MKSEMSFYESYKKDRLDRITKIIALIYKDLNDAKRFAQEVEFVKEIDKWTGKALLDAGQYEYSLLIEWNN